MSSHIPSAEYRVIALDMRAKRIQMHLQAKSHAHVQALLKQQNLTAIHIKKCHPFFKKKKKLSKQKCLQLTDALYQGIRAQLPLTQLLINLARTPSFKNIKTCLYTLHQHVEQGSALSDALGQFPHYFSPDYRAMIAAGEKHGDLAKAFAQTKRTLKQRCAITRMLKKALTYPCIVLAIATLITSALIVFIIPQFTHMYAELGTPLPYPTQLLLAILHQCKTMIPLLGIGAAIGSLTFQWLCKRNCLLKHHAQKTCLKVPLIGRWMRTRYPLQWLTIVGSLLAGGVPILQALKSGQEATSHAYFKHQLSLCEHYVSQGKLLSESLAQADFFLAHQLNYIRMGEQHGRLGQAMLEQSEQMHQQLSFTIEQTIQLLEPLIMVILSLVMGSILIVLYLPLFHLGQLF